MMERDVTVEINDMPKTIPLTIMKNTIRAKKFGEATEDLFAMSENEFMKDYWPQGNWSYCRRHSHAFMIACPGCADRIAVILVVMGVMLILIFSFII